AMQMAFLEHNDDINDRIIAEIRKSRFVVADFTGNRGGVYFEAGFALGLGKPVIWTCKRSFFEEHGVHFDTQARNHILWDEPADLRRALQARIEATVPRTT
ncbi:MAG: nucleoside 2-deoxyribosyltransferase, partial [Gammaproteobacteria bacterium]|nr:nucleoside 2-deoxyribosyltransferase [Gammaproteobacteria bacterium]